MENIPSEVGQLVEVKSFLSGFRGAWFRCKIKHITERHGIPLYVLESCDYLDDKPNHTLIYQVPPHGRGNKKEKRRELMLRPQYPPIYNEKQMPHVNEISEVIVIVCDSWKVGDLVDWMDSGCFWCGNITEVFDDQEAQIELRPPPRGQGGSYKVHFKDLRPSLDWSPERGWTLPTQEDGTGNPCARLIEPIDQVMDASLRVEDTRGVGVKDVSRYDELNARSLFYSHVLPKSATSSDVKSTSNMEMRKGVYGTTLFKEQKNDLGKNAIHGYEDGNIKETNRANTNSNQSADEQVVVDILDDMSRKKYKTSGEDTLNSKRYDTIEAIILDLEEDINRIKWLKKVLQHGISSF